jgi:acyl dehydratase
MSKEEVIAELKAAVGTEVHVGPWLSITQERIDQFAEATGDFQWIHVNPERAQNESPYGTTIAHGFLTLSLIPNLTESVDESVVRYPGIKMAINYGLNRVRFPNAVAVGAKVRARTERLQVEEIKGSVQLVDQVTVEVEGEEKPACVAETVTRLYF